MIVDAILYADAVTPERVGGKSVAVVDVFRATSVIVEALHNGARAMIPVVSVENAALLCRKFDRSQLLLGGERDTVIIEGFDLDNSPLAYKREVVEGKTIIQTTTNGTRAIHNSRFAKSIFVSSFLNMSAVCEAMAKKEQSIVLVCAGRDNTFTAEDGLCVGAMANILATQHGYKTSDIAEVLQRMYVDAKDDLKGRLSSTLHYNDILGRGYIDDINYCLQHDIYDDVPYYNANGEVVLKQN